MAPFRPSGRSNRSGRSQADHDVFEGLPIKQWRQSEATVGLPQVVGDTKTGDAWPELPMPRDSHLLSPVTQALLREARRPRLAKRKEPTEDEKGEEDEDTEKEMQTGFLAKKWTHVPAHLEEPEREYLAKRRKGLPSVHTTLALQAAINIPLTAVTRKAKVMKSDAQGNTTVYEVLVPEGQVVEGEIQQDTEMIDATLERAAPGTIIEGVGIANAEGVIVANDLLQPQAPPRRRNMPPKRVKKGGPGRGKKKVMFTADGQAGTSTPGGTGVPSTPANGAGEPMDIDSARKEGDDGEGEDEDDDDDDDREDGELTEGEVGPQETPSRPSDSVMPSEANGVSVPTPVETKEETQPKTELTEDDLLRQEAASPMQDVIVKEDEAEPEEEIAPDSESAVASFVEVAEESKVEDEPSTSQQDVDMMQEQDSSTIQKSLSPQRDTSKSPEALEAQQSTNEQDPPSAPANEIEESTAEIPAVEPPAAEVVEASPTAASPTEAVAIEPEVTEPPAEEPEGSAAPAESPKEVPDEPSHTNNALSFLERALDDQDGSAS
ncbi:hypothetical protein BDV97DRAFT_362417 [Delphinella strobiligena]|nr:hypothetical protein BDV97DRAFT_362417 [Delphinella strobiligena]